MADEKSEETDLKVKIKQEVNDIQTPPKPPPSASNRPVQNSYAPASTNPGQQKITAYFKNSKNLSSSLSSNEENERRSPPLDEESAKGAFGWASFGSVYIPFLLRKGVRYAAVRIIEGKILKKFLRVLPSDIYSCTYIKSYFITETEAKLLNEINIQHCDYQFGYDQFTPKDLVVPLDDAQQFYEFLETCYYKLLEPETIQPSHKNRCGFLKINNIPIPYVVRNAVKYLPLLFFEKDIEILRTKAKKLESWEFSYLKFCCNVTGLYHESVISQSTLIISLDDLLQLSNGKLIFEEWWPTQVKSFNEINCYKQFKLSDHTSSDVNFPSSIFQSPIVVSPKGFFSKGVCSSKSDTSKEKLNSPQDLSSSNTSSLPPKSIDVPLPISFHSQPSLSSFLLGDSLPVLPASPWSSSQPFLFNADWWNAMNSSVASTVAESAKSIMCPPTVIPAPNLNMNKLMEQNTTFLNPHQKEKEVTSRRRSTHSPASADLSFCKSASEKTSNSDHRTVCPPPPPLVRVPNFDVNNLSTLPGSSTSYLNDSSSRHENSTLSTGATAADLNISRRKSVDNVESSNFCVMNGSLNISGSLHDLNSVCSDFNELASGDKNQSAVQNKAKPDLRPSLSNNTYNLSPYASISGKITGAAVENQVVAPGMQHNNVKQTSPKPANPVPAMTTGSVIPFVGRPPPPPLITTNGITAIPLSLTTVHAPEPSFFSSPRNSSASDSSFNFQNDAHIMNTNSHGFCTSTINNSLSNYANQQPYQLQLTTIEGKKITVINKNPYVFNGDNLASLHEVVAVFFPTHTVESCQFVLSEVLRVTLHRCNRLQQQLLQEKYSQDFSEDGCLTLINISDLINYMPQLKYMFSRQDCKSNSYSFTPNHGHASKRIKL